MGSNGFLFILKDKFQKLFIIFAVLCFSFFISSTAFATPKNISFQSKIYKPDGTPLEAASVQFKFSLMNPISTCVIYSETFSPIDLSSSAGNVVLALGSGTRSYPAAGGMQWSDAFNNSTASYTCQSTGTYSPTLIDNRRLVMQFNDGSGSGWQTMPAMDINSVPFAMFAENSEKLEGHPAADFVLASALPTCAGSDVLTFNGTTISCVTAAAATSIAPSGITAGGASAGQVLKWNGSNWVASSDLTGGAGGVTSVASANLYLTVTNGTSTPSLTLNVGAAANTVAAGDDSRITGAFQTSTTLSGDLTGTLPNAVVAPLAITNAKINDVAFSKITGKPTTLAGYGITDGSSSSLLSANIFVGNASNIAMGVVLSGDATITNAGILTINNNAITNAKINDVAFSKITGKPTTLAGYTIAMTSSDVTTALGYTPGSGGGTVSSVMAASTTGNPITVSASSTSPSIDISRANGTTNGYLASSDWTTFNSKLSNFSTMVSTDVTTALGYTPSTQLWTKNASNDVTYSAGNVGIGTAAPSARLDVLGLTNQTQFSVTSVSGQTSWAASFKEGGSSKSINIDAAMSGFTHLGSSDFTFYNTTPGYNVLFGTVGAERMRISSNGNVGIGTATPAYALSVSGDVNVTGNFKVNGVNISSGTGSVTGVTAASTTGNPITVSASTTSPSIDITRATVAANGYLASSDFSIFNNKLTSTLSSANIFVGNASNVATGVVLSGDATITNAGILTINNNAITNAKINDVAFSKITGKPTTLAGYTIAMTSSDVTTALGYTPGSGGGTVGSVTAASTTGNPITVSASSTSPSIDISRANGTTNGYLASSDWTTFNSKLSNFSTMASTDVTAALGYTPSTQLWTKNASNDVTYSAGNVGIGTTTPIAKLDVVGGNANFGSGYGLSWNSQNSYISATSNIVTVAGYSGITFYSAVNTADQIFTNNQTGELMRIKGTGKVGIGTSTPAYSLSVSGDVNVTGNFKMNGVNISTGSGSVTGVTAASTTGNPIIVSASSTSPSIDITRATVAANGYLASSDFSIFNSKLSASLSAANIFVGNASNIATGVVLSGDATITNAGILTINNNAITNAKINDVAFSKLTGKPTTLAGYTIAMTSSDVTTALGYTPGTGGGTVSSVTAASTTGNPITVSASSTSPSIDISRANGTTNGYLASSDWTTFNSKLSNFSTMASTDVTAALGYTPSTQLWTKNASNDVTYSAGNVGIGTAAPTATLDINTLSPSLKLTDNRNGAHTPGTYGSFSFYTSDSSGIGIHEIASIKSVSTLTAAEPNGELALFTAAYDQGATEKVRIDQSGNVGIGTTTPAAVVPPGLSSGASGRYLEVTSASVAVPSGLLLRRNDGVTGLDLTNDSNLGTTNIDNRWDNATSVLNFRMRTAGTTVNAMTILGAGKVGIGTSTPAYSLSVSGDVSVTGNFKVNGVNISTGSGSVTGVTAASTTGNPITVSASATSPSIDITRATASVNGYLASSDFTAFNSKLTSTLSSANIFVGNASNIATGVVLSGDATISNAGILTLSNVVTPGTYPRVTVDAKGRVTAGSALLSSDVTSSLGYTPVNRAGDTMTGTLNLPSNGLVVGTNQLVTSGGNVGVGVASPSTKLAISGDTSIGDTYVATGLAISRTTVAVGPAATLRGIYVNEGAANDSTVLEGINSTVSSGIGNGFIAITGTANNIIYSATGSGIGVIGTANQSNMAGAGTAIGVKGVANGVGAGGGGSTYAGYFDNTTAVAGSNYGIYVNTTSSGTYGIYQAGGVKNYFSGKVGIGTTTPAYSLSVSGDVSVTGNFKVNGVNISTGTGSVTGVTAASTSGNPITVSASSTSPSIDITRATASVNGYLASSDFTTFNNKLSTSLASASIFVGNASNAAQAQVLSGDATMTNAGILTINNNAITNAKINDVAFSKLTGKPTTISGYGISMVSTDVTTALGYAPTTGIGWVDGGSGKIYYSGGNVGIGMATPSNSLTVGDDSTGATPTPNNTISVGNATGNAVLTLGQNATNRGRLAWLYNATVGSAYMALGTSAGSGNSLILQDVGGNVGIGTTTPAYALTVSGDVSVSGTFRVGGRDIASSAWQTLTANTTVAVNSQIFADTSGGAFTITLPASPAVGDTVKIIDVSGSFDTLSLIVARNGNKIMSLTQDLTVDTKNISFELIWSGATYGWRIK